MPSELLESRPLEVPGRRRVARRRGSAAARCSCAASCGAASAARPMSTDSTGLTLLRHGRRAAAPSAVGSASSPISGRSSDSTSLAIRPQASVVVVERDRRAGVTGARLVRQGGAPQTEPPAAATVLEGALRRLDQTGEPRELHDRRQVPAAPPNWAGQSTVEVLGGVERRRAARSPALSPNVIGTACWVSVRPIIGRVAVVRGRAASARRPGGVHLGARWSPTASRAQQDERGVEHVLAGQPAVQPPCGGRAARVRSGPAAAPPAGITGLPPSSAAIASASRSAVATARERSVAWPSTIPISINDANQAASTAHHRVEQRGVAHESAGPLITGPEQVLTRARGNSRTSSRSHPAGRYRTGSRPGPARR